MTKAEIARRQLGTALSLYLDDLDPVSVHCLACGGCEIVEHLAIKAGKLPLKHFTLDANPSLDDETYKTIRNRYWNAFKHIETRKGIERDDTALIADFSEKENKERLFLGWFDYQQAVGSSPIEARVFTTWFLAHSNNPMVGENAERFIAELEAEFPLLKQQTPAQQKQRLRRGIEKWRATDGMMDDPKTDRRNLILP